MSMQRRSGRILNLQKVRGLTLTFDLIDQAYCGSHITHEGSISLKSFRLKMEKSISFSRGSNELA